jgi:hypothetical protein
MLLQLDSVGGIPSIECLERYKNITCQYPLSEGSMLILRSRCCLQFPVRQKAYQSPEAHTFSHEAPSSSLVPKKSPPFCSAHSNVRNREVQPNMFLIRQVVSLKRTLNFCRLSKKGEPLASSGIFEIGSVSYITLGLSPRLHYSPSKGKDQRSMEYSVPNSATNPPQPAISKCRRPTATYQSFFELAAFGTFNGLQMPVRNILSVLEKAMSMHQRSRPRSSSSIGMNVRFLSRR